MTARRRVVFAVGRVGFRMVPLRGRELSMLYRVRLFRMFRAQTITFQPVLYARPPFD